MKREFRITDKREFQEIIEKGKSLKDKQFIVFYRLNNLSKTRIGISAPTKIGNAVIRNRTRRQIRAQLNEAIDFTLGMDVIIIAKAKYLTFTYQENLVTIKNIMATLGGNNAK